MFNLEVVKKQSISQGLSAFVAWRSAYWGYQVIYLIMLVLIMKLFSPRFIIYKYMYSLT